MKMQIRKDGTHWNVRWIQDGTPRRYWAAYWLEAVHFACAQLRAMEEAKP